MNWIRVATKMKGDPRLGALAMACGVRVHEAVGLACCLLMELPEHARDGDVSEVPDVILEQWALWTGRPGLFAKAFRAQFCDEAGVVRAWEKHNGAALRRADAELERKRAARNVRNVSARKSAEKRADTSPMSARRPHEIRDVSCVDVDVDVITTTTPAAAAVAVVAAAADTDPPPLALAPPEVPPELRGMVADVVDTVAGIPHAEAVVGAMRAARNPHAVAAELKAWASGMRGHAVEWPVLCRAVHEMQVADVRLSANTLGGFVRRLLAEDRAAPEDDDAAWNRLIEAANAAGDA